MVGAGDLRLVEIIWLKVSINFCKNLKKAASSGLLTCFQLQKCHVLVNADCPLCNSHAKIVQHALVECEFSKAAWNLSMVHVRAGAATFSSWLLGIFDRGHEDEMEEVAVVNWAIRRARNEFVWQKKSWSASNIVASARNMLDQYKFSQGRKGLSLSSLHDGEGRFGMGCVAQNHHGAMVEAVKKGKIGCVQPEIAEIIGIKEALS
ncbi:hypothetical protein CsatA_009598 [Cannabis sativa]